MGEYEIVVVEAFLDQSVPKTSNPRTRIDDKRPLSLAAERGTESVPAITAETFSAHRHCAAYTPKIQTH